MLSTRVKITTHYVIISPKCVFEQSTSVATKLTLDQLFRSAIMGLNVNNFNPKEDGGYLVRDLND
jgi:hypothetical protein